MLDPFGPLSIVALIFGGCCSNVFALEAIIRTEPRSGLLITFFQFFFTAAAAYWTQFSSTSKWTVRTPTVPVRRWAVIALSFFLTNMLNNWAFAYDISVPVHIILRSFGSVSTMIAGVIRGKRYSPLQVLSVVVLTVGVLVSAWADSQSKGKSMSMSRSSSTSSSSFATGLGILLLAQFLSAWMGVYVEDTYSQYKATWDENLFYGHLLSLPLFLPFTGILRSKYADLASTPPVDVKRLLAQADGATVGPIIHPILEALAPFIIHVPQGIVFLLANAVTQLACISGVNLLSAKSSAVTVTIVLNIRKLVSFIFSTILFGHQLSPLMIFGAALVFGSGALYGWETSWRLPRQRSRHVGMNGSSKK